MACLAKFGSDPIRLLGSRTWREPSGFVKKAILIKYDEKSSGRKNSSNHMGRL